MRRPNKEFSRARKINAAWRSTTPTVRRLAVIFAAISISLGGAEVLLRLVWPQIFPEYPKFMLSPDPVLGHTLTPNFRGKFERSEFSVDVRFNEQGLRGTALSLRTEETLRIACLGDSLTWGWGVEAHETYCELLGVYLSERFERLDIQTVNAGTPFYGTNDELSYFQQRGSAIDADVVVLLFNAANDFEQSRWRSVDRHIFSDGILTPTQQYVTESLPMWLRTLESLKHKSHLVKLLSENSGYILMRMGLLATLQQTSGTHNTRDMSALAIAAFKSLCDDAHTAGSKLVFVFAPEKMQILAGSDTTNAGSAALLAVAETESDLVLDLTPRLLAEPDRSSQFGRYEGYWTAKTHRLVASALAESIAASVIKTQSD